jgi:DNA end-binding protein Ku
VAPRAYWKGYLKLSLVSCPIALYPASSEREKVSFHQLNKNTGNRIKYRKVDADTGDEVDPSDIIKGYEVGKGQYIEVNPEELEAIALESKRTIESDEFVPRDQIDVLYLNNPYFIVPDGDVGAEAFAVIREAISKEGWLLLEKSSSHRASTSSRWRRAERAWSASRSAIPMRCEIRYPYEVRKEQEYFDDIPDPKITKDMLELATHIIETKAGEFDPKKFEDQYEDAVKELLKKKQAGEKIEAPKEREPANVVNLMEALRQSIKAGGGARGKQPAR